MKLIVGLGNPGTNYLNTIHNLGFMALDQLASTLGLSIKKNECDCLTAKNQTVILAKPLTYMNLSGIAVKKMLNYYKLSLADLLVVLDDIDIEIGKIRYKASGSGGTHNGLKSVIEHLDSKDFCRIRIGAGRPMQYMDLADYVLSPIAKHNKALFDSAIEQAVEQCLLWAGLA